MSQVLNTFWGGSAKVEILKSPDGHVFAKKTLTDLQLAARFKREVKYQRAFNHKNIVQIGDADLDAVPPWYTMPAALCTLFQCPSQSQSFIFDILNGLEAIHAEGLSHRDLKPQNVLIFHDENGVQYAAISDFGLISVPKDAITTRLTLTGMAGGTLSYSAPECFTDFKNAGFRADMYSIGAILYDIYIGAPRTPCEELAPDGAIGFVIQRCTFRRPEMRFSSVSELRDALQLAFSGGRRDSLRQPLLRALQLCKEKDYTSLPRILPELNSLGTNDEYKSDFFQAITPEFILRVKHASTHHFNQLLENFAIFIANTGFSFSYCDTLAELGKVFYENGDENGKALVSVAILELGVSHNRYYVEDVFMTMANVSINESLALKMRNAAIRLGIDLFEKVETACSSLGRTTDNVHELLVNR